MHLNSVDQQVSREFVAETMRERLGSDARLSEKLIPKYALGCRRMTPGSDYLQSLRRSNVEVISGTAVEFAEDGVIDASGNKSVVDVVVCATGFDTTFALPYTVIGKDGRNLRKEWGDFPKGYLSVMAEGFPNLFCKPSSHPNPQSLTLSSISLHGPQRPRVPRFLPAHRRMAPPLHVHGPRAHATD